MGRAIFSNKVTGESFSVFASFSISDSIQGEQTASISVPIVNKGIEKVTRGWTIDFGQPDGTQSGGVYHVMTASKNIGSNSNITIDIQAVSDFIFKMTKSNVEVNFPAQDDNDKDLTYQAVTLLDAVFGGLDGVGYQIESGLSLPDTVGEAFGYQRRYDMLLRLCRYWGVDWEFTRNSNTVTIVRSRGDNLSKIVRYRMNLDQLQRENQASSFVTYATGIGAWIDEKDHSRGRLIAHYESPLMAVYGKIEAELFIDDSYTDQNALLAALKSQVDSTYAVSTNVSLSRLQTSTGFSDDLEVGDRIQVICDPVGINESIRIIKTTHQYDEFGRLLDVQLSCGSMSLRDKKVAEQRQQNKAMKAVTKAYSKDPNKFNENVANSLEKGKSESSTVPEDILNRLANLEASDEKQNEAITDINDKLDNQYALKSWVLDQIKASLGNIRDRIVNIMNGNQQ